MKLVLLLGGLLCSLQATTVILTADCTYDGVTSHGMPSGLGNSCATGGPGVTVEADSRATSFGNLGSGLLGWNVRGDASAFPNASHQLGHTGHALGIATVDQDVYTAGPVRSGFAFFQYAFGVEGNGSFVSISATFGSFSTPTCTLSMSCNNSLFIPISLGGSLSLTINGIASAFGGSTQVGGAGFGGSINIQLYEADKTTKVAFAEAPEPPTEALLGLSLTVLVACKRFLKPRRG